MKDNAPKQRRQTAHLLLCTMERPALLPVDDSTGMGRAINPVKACSALHAWDHFHFLRRAGKKQRAMNFFIALSSTNPRQVATCCSLACSVYSGTLTVVPLTTMLSPAAGARTIGGRLALVIDGPVPRGTVLIT